MIKIVIQSKGRLKEDSLKFLEKIGLEFDSNILKERNYRVKALNDDVEIIFLRDDDIPSVVEKGLADFGIVGLNEVLEKQVKIKILKELDFAKCRLVLALPEDSHIQDLKNLSLERVATSYPTLTKAWLKDRSIKASVIELSGSVEIAPELNLADAIVDLTESGNTLKEHSLREVATILNSRAVLIESRFWKKEKEDFKKKVLL